MADLTFTERRVLLRRREQLASSNSQLTRGRLPLGNWVVLDEAGCLLNGRTGVFDRNIADAMPVSSSFDPSLVGGTRVADIKDAVAGIRRYLEDAISLTNQGLGQ